MEYITTKYRGSTNRQRKLRSAQRLVVPTKSYSAAHDAMLDCILPGKRVWIVGPNYGLAEKEFHYIHQKLVIERDRIGFPKPLVCHANARSGSLLIKWPHGSVLEGKSAERPEGLLGEAVDTVIYSEAAQLPRQIREKYVEPTLMTKKGREIIPTTPEEGAEWVHELFMWGQEGKFGIDSFQWDGESQPSLRLGSLREDERSVRGR